MERKKVDEAEKWKITYSINNEHQVTALSICCCWFFLTLRFLLSLSISLFAVQPTLHLFHTHTRALFSLSIDLLPSFVVCQLFYIRISCTAKVYCIQFSFFTYSFYVCSTHFYLFSCFHSLGVCVCMPKSLVCISVDCVHRAMLLNTTKMMLDVGCWIMVKHMQKHVSLIRTILIMEGSCLDVKMEIHQESYHSTGCAITIQTALVESARSDQTEWTLRNKRAKLWWTWHEFVYISEVWKKESERKGKKHLALGSRFPSNNLWVQFSFKACNSQRMIDFSESK